MTSVHSLTKGLCCFCLLTSCSNQPHQPEDLELPVFDHTGQTELFDQMCQTMLRSETLQLLQQLADQNLQLDGAWARVRRAQAQADQAHAGLLPSIRFNVEASRGEALTRSQQGQGQSGGLESPSAAETGPTTADQTLFQASLAAEYELDLWNRLDRLTHAADYQTMARHSDAQAMAVSLSAQLLESWFDLGFYHQLRILLNEQLAVSQQLLDLLKLRFLKGQTSALDSIQQQQQVKSVRAALARNRAQRARAENQIQVLLGEEPNTASRYKPAELSTPLVPNQDIDVSAALLAARPDLKAAFYQVQAADARVAAVMAERMPGVRLTATLFDQSREADQLGNSLLWRIVAAITQPLFTGGRISAEIDTANAELDEAVSTYQHSLLTALQESANAWTAEQQSAERATYLIEQQDLAQDAYRLVRKQYQRGAVDFLRVLNALQSMIDVQQEVLRTHRQQLSYRLQFCRALGNDWLKDNPVKPEPNP